MESENNHKGMQEILKQNAELLAENNKLLKKIHRSGVWGIWIRIIWYTLLLGLPFAMYFYLLEPYFSAMGASYEVFNAGMKEIPGLKQFTDVLKVSE